MVLLLVGWDEDGGADVGGEVDGMLVAVGAVLLVVDVEEKEAVGVVVPEAEGVTVVVGGCCWLRRVVDDDAEEPVVVLLKVGFSRSRLARKDGSRIRGGCEHSRRIGRWNARVCAVQRPRKKMYWRTRG